MAGARKLPEWKNKRSMELSKGMQQKIQFITSVIHDPDLLILDEPFSGLDPINVELLKEIVLDLKRAGKTIIFSTHQMEVAEKICDDICLLNRSQKVFEGSLREIKSSFGRNSVAVRCEGGDGVLDDPALVSKVVRHADEAQALLATGADAQVLLKRLIDSGAVIGKFEMVEPSLNDIFITKVTEPMMKFLTVVKRIHTACAREDVHRLNHFAAAGDVAVRHRAGNHSKYQDATGASRGRGPNRQDVCSTQASFVWRRNRPGRYDTSAASIRINDAVSALEEISHWTGNA